MGNVSKEKFYNIYNTCTSTEAACSPPITEIRAFGHININLELIESLHSVWFIEPKICRKTRNLPWWIRSSTHSIVACRLWWRNQKCTFIYFILPAPYEPPIKTVSFGTLAQATAITIWKCCYRIWYFITRLRMQNYNHIKVQYSRGLELRLGTNSTQPEILQSIVHWIKLDKFKFGISPNFHLHRI